MSVRDRLVTLAKGIAVGVAMSGAQAGSGWAFALATLLWLSIGLDFVDE